MSSECSECERDARGGHDRSCSRYQPPTSTLQLACPTCGDEIEVEYEVHCADCWTDPVSVQTWCFHPVSQEDAHALLMDYGARQAELATERAGERP